MIRFYLDTANLEAIKRFDYMGLVDGVTTNPSLIAKEKGEFLDIVKPICDWMGERPVSLEVTSTSYEEMVEEGKRLAAIAENAVVKIPMTPEGMQTVYSIAGRYVEGHRNSLQVNVTLVFSAQQGLLASKAGAHYVSPFIGRIDDIGYDGMQVVRDLVKCDVDAKIIVGSVRHPQHVLEAAKAGADIVTMPPEVMEKMLYHPLTDIGLKKFLEDSKKQPL